MASIAEQVLALVDTEPFALPEARLDPITGILNQLRGTPELADAIEELARLAGYFMEQGAAEVADSLLSIIGAQASNLRALRVRLCGQDEAEAAAAERLQRFAETPRDRVAPTHRPQRDFRIALLANRGEAK
ncbi:MAG: hypothetical protein U1E65_17385 [Myxococcota bacterium]